MDGDITALESKLDQFLAHFNKLREENRALHERVVGLEGDKKVLTETIADRARATRSFDGAPARAMSKQSYPRHQAAGQGISRRLSARGARIAAGRRELLDERMGEMATKSKSTGERLAVMTALNLAHEMLSQKNPQAGAHPVAHSGAHSDVDRSDLKRRIRAMEARLDEALAQQEKLF